MKEYEVIKMVEQCPFAKTDPSNFISLLKICDLDGCSCPPNCFLGDYKERCPTFNDYKKKPKRVL